MSSSISDEFDLYDFSEFSSAELSLVDAVASRTHIPRASTPLRQAETWPSSPRSRASARGWAATGPSSGGPQIAIEVETATDSASVGLVKAPAASARGKDINHGGIKANGKSHMGLGEDRSPFERYRWKRILSVSDLVGPAWCEVQFDYGLRQGRSRKLADRPASFVSAEGKTITVAKEVAVVNEKTLKRGRSVHKELEREIKPEEVPVNITTEEERWALRLVNMIACLDNLMELGFSREMPVFGVIQDQVVTGIIDEISRKPSSSPPPPSGKSKKRASSSAPGTPQKSKKRRAPSPSPSESQLTSYFTSHTSPAPAPALHPRTYTLHILDTKTRRAPSLPSDDDALSSRLQLMLYQRLLSALLSPAFPFAALWARLSVNPFLTLSDNFLIQSGLVPNSPDAVLGYPSCLDDLVDLWRATVATLNVDGVSPALTIVYRSQPRGGGKRKSNPVTAEMNAAAQEARDLARAIEASLRGSDDDLERALAKSLKELAPSVADVAKVADILSSPKVSKATEADPQLAWLAQDGLLERAQPKLLETISESVQAEDEGERATDFLSPVLPVEAPPPSNEDMTSHVLGQKEFLVDEDVLDAHLKSILQWWHGKRAPQGVDIEHSRRCFSCEYRDGCEWRERKASEAAGKYESLSDAKARLATFS